MAAPQQMLLSYKAAVAVTYATRNPSDKNANITLSGGDLIATATNDSWKSARANQGKSSGKWYWEIIVGKSSGGWNAMLGVGQSTASLSIYCGADATSWSYYSYISKGDAANAYTNNVNTVYGTPFLLNDVIGVALNMDDGELEFFRNNTSQGVFTGLSGTMYPMVSPYDSGVYFVANFGATPLTYTPPSGFNAGLYI